MKRIISILIAITLVISVFAIIPLTTASADDTQTVYIGINSTLGQDFDTSTARVHYWGGDGGSGDAALTDVGTDKEIDEITYVMYQAEIPADATGFKFHNGETWYGGDGTISKTCNAAFVNGLNDVAYGYYSVPAVDPTVSPTEPAVDPTVSPTEPAVDPTVSPTEPAVDPTGSPEEPGESTFYVVGTFNEWQTKAAYQMTKNAVAEGEYYLNGVEMSRSDEFKIVETNGSIQDFEPVWYPDGFDNNYVVNADGIYNIYFRPNCDGSEDWYCNCLYVADVTPEEPTEPAVDPTESPTEPAVDPTGSPEEPGESTFFVVGSFNEWQTDSTYMMIKNAKAEGEYYLNGVELTTESQFKVVKVENGEIKSWYPDGMGNSYGENGEITQEGIYTVYFRPDADGGDDWFYNCIYVAEVTPEEPTEPAVDPTESPTEPASEPASEPGSETAYYLVGDFTDWQNNDSYKLAVNPEDELEYVLKSVCLPSGSSFKVRNEERVWYPGDYSGNYEIDETGYYDIYFRPAGNGGDGWFYGYIYAERVSRITGYNIGLMDEIAFWFYASIGDDDGMSASCTLSNSSFDVKETPIEGEAIVPDASNGYANYKFFVPVPAKSMVDTITLSVKQYNDELILSGSSSVAEYAVKLHRQDDSYDDLLCAMLDYGKESMRYFGYNTSESVSDFIGQINPDWASPDAPAALEDTTTLKKSAVNSFKGTIMETASKTAIYLYFDKDETAAISVVGYDYDITEVSGMKRLAITGIPAKKIFTDITVRIGNDAYIYNAANYYNAIHNSTSEKINAASGVIERMYVYYQEAAALT